MLKMIELNWMDKSATAMKKPYEKKQANEFFKDKTNVVDLTLYRYKINKNVPEYNEIRNSLLIWAWKIYQTKGIEDNGYYFTCLGNYLKDILRNFKAQKNSSPQIFSISSHQYNNSSGYFDIEDDAFDIEDTNQSEIHNRIGNIALVEKLEKNLSPSANKFLMELYMFEGNKKKGGGHPMTRTKAIYSKIKRCMKYTDKQIIEIQNEIKDSIRKINIGINESIPIYEKTSDVIRAEII